MMLVLITCLISFTDQAKKIQTKRAMRLSFITFVSMDSPSSSTFSSSSSSRSPTSLAQIPISTSPSNKRHKRSPTLRDRHTRRSMDHHRSSYSYDDYSDSGLSENDGEMKIGDAMKKRLQQQHYSEISDTSSSPSLTRTRRGDNEFYRQESGASPPHLIPH